MVRKSKNATRGPRGRQGPRGISGQPGVRGWPGAAGTSQTTNLADLETDIEILIFELHKLRTEFDELRQSLSGLLRPRPVIARPDKRLRERRGT